MIRKNVSLKEHNSFGIDVEAAYFATFNSAAALIEILSDYRQLKKSNRDHPLIVGGGSNILLTQPVKTLVLKNEIMGIEVIHEDEHYVHVKVGAGVVWHRFVEYCLSHNLAGAENLALIPGNVGASPMQNIGAYGAELKDIFYSLEAWHLKDMVPVNFSNNDCAFGYRDSIFKQKYKGQFVIMHVVYRLSKKVTFNIEYGAIRQALDQMKVKTLSIQAIAEAVIQIRQSKLPDPKQIGNAGSFFKNPSVNQKKFEQLQKHHPTIVGHTLETGAVKLAAGWMIEQCGWKGFRDGDAGCHNQQALVLVNYGNATGKQIRTLSKRIQQSVWDKFSVKLETEVNII